MAPIEHPITSRLEAIAIKCLKSRSVRQKIDEYCSMHGNAGTLSDERTLWLEKTEATIILMADANSAQIQLIIRNQPFQVQYFFVERLLVMTAIARYDATFLSGLDAAQQIGHILVELLQDYWAKNLVRIRSAGTDLDDYVHRVLEYQAAHLD